MRSLFTPLLLCRTEWASAQRGFMIGPILYLIGIAGVGAAVLFSGYSNILRTNIEVTRENTARNDLNAAAETLSASSSLSVDSTTLLPPDVEDFASLSADDTAKLPTGYANADDAGTPTDTGVYTASAGVKQLDPWGRFYIYCRWEELVASGSNDAMKLISAGADKTLNSDCGDTTAQNDDKMEHLTVSQAINRANVWQVVDSGGTQEVRYGVSANPVRVQADGTIMGTSLTLSGDATIGGALIGASLDLTAPLPLSEGGTGASLASIPAFRAHLGSGTTGDALFTSVTAAGARTTLGATTVGDAVFIAADAGAGRTALGATTVGDAVFTAADAGAGRTALGASTVGDAVFTAADAGAGRTALGATTLGDTLFTAASAAAGRTALGASAVGDDVFTAASAGAAQVAIGGGATGIDVFVADTQGEALTALGLLGGANTLDVNVTGTAATATEATTLTNASGILAGVVAINRGGTAASDAATARSNLGANSATNLTTGTLSEMRLPASGVTAGAYNWGTVDAYGRVTAANNVTAGESILVGDTGITAVDTGSDGTLTFSTEGAARMVIDENGYVGIGTTDPQERLHVNAGNIRLEGDAATTRYYQLTTDGTMRWAFGANATAESGSNAGSNFVINNYDDAGTIIGTPLTIGRSTGNAIFTGTVTASSFVGDGSGLTGLPSSTPAADSLDFTEFKDAMALDASTSITADGTEVLSIVNTGPGNSLVVNDEAGDASPFVIDASGNVGVGTSSPQNKLHLSGGHVAIDGTYALYLGTTAGATPLAAVLYNQGEFRMQGLAPEVPLVFMIDSAEKMRVNTDGNVAIGTTTASAKLAVSNSTWDQDPLFVDNQAYGGRGVAIQALDWDNVGLPYYGNLVIQPQEATVGDPIRQTAGIVLRSRHWDAGFSANRDSSFNFNEVRTGTDYADHRLAVSTSDGNGNWERFSITGEGDVGIGTSSPDRMLHVERGWGPTNSVTPLARFTSMSEGTPAAGIGVGIEFEVETAADNNEVGATIEAVATDVTPGSEDFAVVLKNMAGGAAATETVRVTSAGSVGIGTDSPDASAILELSTTGRGFLLPRMTETERDAISSPATGLQVYNTTANRAEFYDGDSWEAVGTGAGSVVGALDDLTDAETDYVTDFNMFLGDGSGAAIDTGGQFNLGLGQDALTAVTTGDYNLAIGSATLASLTTGSYNVAIGPNALAAATTGTGNTAVGVNALASNTTGTNNAAFGGNVLGSVTTGYANTGVGVGALNATTIGHANTAMGYGALYANTIGANNVAIGFGALGAATAGENNAFGYNALSAVTTGTKNTAVGHRAGDNITTGSQNVIIGYDVDAPSATADGQIVIGNLIYGTGATGTGTTVSSSGKVGIGTNAPTHLLTVAGDMDLTGDRTLRFDNTHATIQESAGVLILDAANEVRVVDCLLVGESESCTTSGNLRLRSTLGNAPYMSFTESGSGVRGSLGFPAGSADFVIETGPSIIGTGDERLRITSSGNVGIGTNSPVASAILELSTTGKGFPLSRVTTTQRDAISSPATGLQVYNSTTNKPKFYDGDSWESVGIGAGGDAIAIDDLTDAETDYTTGHNMFLGSAAGASITGGLYNVALGEIALWSNTSGSANTAVGFETLKNNTTGSDNTAVGYDVLESNTTGANNTAFGSAALRTNTTGTANTALGRGALQFSTTGSENTAVGAWSLYANTTGAYNTAVGTGALVTATSSSENTALGAGALHDTTTGAANVAVGTWALYANTTGEWNAALGNGALATATTASGNTALGGGALHDTTTGAANVAVGTWALYANTSGGWNTAVGESALNDNTTGNWNTALGNNALTAVTTGAGNIAVGYAAGDNITTGSQNVIIGHSVDAPSATADGQLVIANMIFGTGLTDIGTTIPSAGKIGIGTNAPTTRLDVSGTTRTEVLRVVGQAGGVGVSGSETDPQVDSLDGGKWSWPTATARRSTVRKTRPSKAAPPRSRTTASISRNSRTPWCWMPARTSA